MTEQWKGKDDLLISYSWHNLGMLIDADGLFPSLVILEMLLSKATQ